MSGVEPIFGGLQMTSTGSRLAAWMKANGEDYAKEELELADEEEDPKEIFPFDIAKLVEDAELRDRMGISRMLKESDRKGQRKRGGIFSPRWYFPLAFSTSCLRFFLSF